MNITDMRTDVASVNVIQSEAAMERIVLFPDKPRTKRRMRRLRGKYGDLVRYKPCAYQTPQGIVVHPSLYAQLAQRARTQALAVKDRMLNAMMRGWP
jgi:hypothetical protein